MTTDHTPAPNPRRTPLATRTGDGELVDWRAAAITGIGVKAPGGLDLATFWDALVAARSAAAPIQAYDASEHPVTFACEVDGFDIGDYLGPKESRRLDRGSHLGWAAAADAIAAAGALPYDPDRSAVVAGTAIGGYRTAGEQHVIGLTRGLFKITPFLVPMVMPNATAGLISVNLGWQGPALCMSTACASSANAIGEAVRLLREGSVDVVIAGGTDALITPYVLAGFARAGAISRRGATDPEHACRPFDCERDGFVMGEGAAFLVLERLDDARARGADIHAVITGYGRNSDAHHVTEPSPGGAGAVRCMELALADAGLTPDRITHVNAHGTSTPYNDRAEGEAVTKLFGAYGVPITAPKGVVGHSIGAAGAVELVSAVLAIEHAQIPPVANFGQLDSDAEVDVVAGAPRPFTPGPVLSNSFAFGGHNACLVVEPEPA